jgi:hypothetical protein
MKKWTDRFMRYTVYGLLTAVKDDGRTETGEAKGFYIIDIRIFMSECDFCIRILIENFIEDGLPSGMLNHVVW